MDIFNLKRFVTLLNVAFYVFPRHFNWVVEVMIYGGGRMILNPSLAASSLMLQNGIGGLCKRTISFSSGYYYNPVDVNTSFGENYMEK